MNTSVIHTPSRRLLSVAVLALVLAGCAANQPAPVSERATGAQEAKPGYYVVRPGDTLLSISRRYNVGVADLVSWNRLGDPNQIEVGQELRVAVPLAAGNASSGNVVVRPIAPPGVEVSPVAPQDGSGNASMPGGLRQGPLGGKVPYSDQALAAARGSAVPAPTAAPTTPPVAVPTPGLPTGWIWPANGKVIATFTDNASKGIDIAGKLGDPVVASEAGKVVYAGSGLRGYGKLVIIKHDADFLTAYAHNRELLVKEGDAVNKGQKIAELGNTDTDRPELHFEVRRQGKPVDPLKFLPSR